MRQTRPGPPQAETAQADLNGRLWAAADLVGHYSNRVLRAVEVILLVRHREALGGRVLELGCGGGRLSGYLIDIADSFHGLDISPAMVAHCRGAYPGGGFEQGDLRDLSRYANGSFDVVFASFNVLDILDDAERRRVLGEVRRMLCAGGLLMMSSHNLAYAPRIPRPTQLRSRNPLRMAQQLVEMPRQVRNWRATVPLQSSAADHAILVDEALDYAVLHYYIGRDAQQRQLDALGFTLLECLDLDGRLVPPGQDAASHPELHYVARRESDGV